VSFKEIKLGEIIHIKHGWAFKGEFFSSNGNLIVVTPGNFFEKGGFKYTIGKEKFYTDKFPEDYLLKKNDLIIAMTEQADGLLGSPALVPENNKFLHNQRIGLITVLDNQKTNIKFIYHLFFDKELRTKIGNSSTGTKVRHTSPKSIYKLSVKLPSLDVQQKIVNLISNYDNLIENNNKKIKLLEEMAEEIYKEWFVRLRFPNYQNTKIVVGIPEGWEDKKIIKLGTVVIGKTPPTSKGEYYNGNIPFIKTPDFKQGSFIIETEETLSNEGGNFQKNQFIPKNSICVSCIGTVGEVVITTKDSQTNQQINSLILNDSNYLEYFYFTFKKLKSLIQAYASTGATMGNLSKGKFEQFKIMTPCEDLVVNYSKLVKPMFDEIKNLMMKNQNLKQTRDLLLPRLISGKLNIEDLDIK